MNYNKNKYDKLLGELLLAILLVNRIRCEFKKLFIPSPSTGEGKGEGEIIIPLPSIPSRKGRGSPLVAVKRRGNLKSFSASIADIIRFEENLNKLKYFVVPLLMMVLLMPGTARGEEKPLWELGIGAGFLQMPDYRGSDKNRFYVLPFPYVIYRGDFLKIQDRRISGQIFKTDRVLLDFSGYGAVPVKSSDNEARAGMEDLDPTFELGPALRINIIDRENEKFKLRLSLPVRAFFSTDFRSVRHEGWIVSPRLSLEIRDAIPQTGLNLGISAGPMFADSSYNAYFYNVEPVYATAIRPAYSAGGGYSGTAATLGLSKHYKQFIFHAFVSADFLDGAVFADSPLVKNKTSIMSGISITWIFFQSAKKGEVRK